jgi:hypothetical protein
MVWQPFVDSKTGLCLLLIDDFKAHMTAKVCRKFAACRTILEIIPPGYTSKLQVMDVGLNKPFKMHYGDQVDCFVRDFTLNNIPGTKAKPGRRLVASWIDTAWGKVTKEMCTNTWKHCDFYPPSENYVTAPYNFLMTARAKPVVPSAAHERNLEHDKESM